eukprot:6317886-Amphidinium_carterae.1
MSCPANIGNLALFWEANVDHRYLLLMTPSCCLTQPALALHACNLMEKCCGSIPANLLSIVSDLQTR